jgi:hypothetical protein
MKIKNIIIFFKALLLHIAGVSNPFALHTLAPPLFE